MASSRNSEPPEPLVAAAAACLQRYLQPQQGLLVAFSGGRDSVALLHVLRSLQRHFGYELSACHVNHGISAEADNWQSFCVRFSTALGVPLRCERVDVPRAASEGLEAAARRLRYEVLARESAEWVAFAHHRGDQAETLLFNLLRGAGLRGATAMPEMRAICGGGALLRPFLSVSRTLIDPSARNI